MAFSDILWSLLIYTTIMPIQLLILLTKLVILQLCLNEKCNDSGHRYQHDAYLLIANLRKHAAYKISRMTIFPFL